MTVLKSNGFKKESILKLIDTKIIKQINSDDLSFIEIIQDLEEKINRFGIIMSSNYDRETIDNAILIFNRKQDIVNIEPKALRYNVCFRGHCINRINDIKWIIKNRYKFNKYDNIKVYNLILLKNKLKENEKKGD